MGQFANIFRLGQVEEIYVGRNADQHALHKVERRQGVEVSGLVLRVEKQRHRQRNEPEAEQEIVDPRNEGGRGEIVVDAQALRDHPHRIRDRCQAPERERQALRAAAGQQNREEQHRAQRELNQIGNTRRTRDRSAEYDHGDMRQPQ